MSNLLKTLAHDLNNNLSILYLRLEKAEKCIQSPETFHDCHNQFHLMKKTLKRMSVICKGVMKDEVLAEIFLEDEIQKMIDQFDHDLIRIEFKNYSDIPTLVESPSLIRALENLIHNSIDQKADLILFELFPDSLIISDSGGGMEMCRIERILAGENETTKGEGHGYGLASLVYFCESHGWGLKMKTEKHSYGKGLVIIINFNNFQ